MAVQKNKKTRAKRDMRRAHDRLPESTLSVDEITGEQHYRHHMTADGFYRGQVVVKTKVKEKNKADTQSETA